MIGFWDLCLELLSTLDFTLVTLDVSGQWVTKSSKSGVALEMWSNTDLPNACPAPNVNLDLIYTESV